MLELRSVTRRFGVRRGLEAVNLAIAGPRFDVLFGGPGSGKSLVLRIIAGLERPDEGAVWLRGSDMTSSAPQVRRVAYVPQSFALYPHLKVFENIAHPLRLARVPRAQIRQRVDEVALTLQISSVLGHYPHQLSGGQRQRVAIARGLVHQADIYLLDDPLVGLDYKIREALMDELRDLQERLKALFVYATSNALEALALADYIHVLVDGRIVDAGTPEQLSAEPRSLWTRLNLGYPLTNSVVSRFASADGRMRCENDLFSVCLEEASGPVHPADSDQVFATFRPEIVRAVHADEVGEHLIGFEAKVEFVEDIGGECILHLATPVGEVLATLRMGVQIVPSQTVEIFGFRPSDVLVYDHAGHFLGRGARAPVGMAAFDAQAARRL
jgi:ABC-type sugar transport system ATPase subunit